MKTQLNNRNNADDQSSFRALSCSTENGNFLRDLALKLLLTSGTLGAGLGEIEAHAKEPNPSPLVQADKKDPIKPINISIQAKACVEMSTLFTEKGVCAVYDFVEKENYLRISIAAGVIVSGGSLALGGGADTVLEVTMDFPIGTDRDEAIKSGKKELEKQLASENVKKKMAALGKNYSKAEPVTNLKDQTKDKSWLERLKIALQKVTDGTRNL
jgi:hypothetical protein